MMQLVEPVSTPAFTQFTCFEECPYAVWIGTHGWLSHGVVLRNRFPFFPFAHVDQTEARLGLALDDRFGD